MFLNSNNILINQLRNQMIAKQRIQSFNTNRNQFGFKYKFGTNGRQNSVWDSIKDKFNEKLLIFVRLLREQSNVYMSLRLRRMAQICGLYNRIYSESTVNKLMSQMLIRLRVSALNSIRSRLNNHKSKDSVKYLMSAVCGLFCWDSHRITDTDLNSTIKEFEDVQRLRFNQLIDDNFSKSTSFSVSAETHDSSKDEMKGNDTEWEAVIIKDNFKLWRRSVKNSPLYQYKVFGTFDDIPARTFFAVQMDTEFRKKWDKLVIKLDVIEREPFVTDRDEQNGEDSGNEILHWIMRYPYPMNTRDYVYLRRSRIDVKQNLMVLISKSIEHPNLPETSPHVRVFNYSSQMVIKPHKSFDECGFDYMLTYFDDPRAAFPSPAYNWMASSGVNDFVEKLHSAALQLHYSNNYKSNTHSKQIYNNSKQNQNSSHPSGECIYA